MVAVKQLAAVLVSVAVFMQGCSETDKTTVSGDSESGDSGEGSAGGSGVSSGVSSACSLMECEPGKTCLQLLQPGCRSDGRRLQSDSSQGPRRCNEITDPEGSYACCDTDECMELGDTCVDDRFWIKTAYAIPAGEVGDLSCASFNAGTSFTGTYPNSTLLIDGKNVNGTIDEFLYCGCGSSYYCTDGNVTQRCQRDQYLDWQHWYDSEDDNRTECGLVDFGVELFTTNNDSMWNVSNRRIDEDGNYLGDSYIFLPTGNTADDEDDASGWNVLQTVNVDGNNPGHFVCESPTMSPRSSPPYCDGTTWYWLPLNVKEINGDIASAMDSLRGDCSYSMGQGDMIQISINVPNREAFTATGCKLYYTFVLQLPSSIRGETGEC